MNWRFQPEKIATGWSHSEDEPFKRTYRMFQQSHQRLRRLEHHKNIHQNKHRESFVKK